MHGRHHGLGMDALANGWAGRMDVIMVLAWMHRPMDGLVAWTRHDADLSDKESGANKGDGAYNMTLGHS